MDTQKTSAQVVTGGYLSVNSLLLFFVFNLLKGSCFVNTCLVGPFVASVKLKRGYELKEGVLNFFFFKAFSVDLVFMQI